MKNMLVEIHLDIVFDQHYKSIVEKMIENYWKLLKTIRKKKKIFLQEDHCPSSFHQEDPSY